MPVTNPRHDQILSYLKSHDSASVKELSSAFYVSEMTIRRDLSEMQTLGLLKRTHGGAVILEPADEISMFVRITENAREKEIAATRALSQIPANFKSVFLDSSSTVLALAQRINLKGKTVVTNSIQTALYLAKVKDINLIILGGNVVPTSASVTGSWTCSLLNEFRFDLMLSSCASIDGTTAYETSFDQQNVKRAVFQRSTHRILIADHTKFNKSASYVFEDLTNFNNVIFDSLPDNEYGNTLRSLPNVLC